ncbi:MAG TPA: TetR/AcrR family transcriptional regulator [Acidiferrobacterales bacterium]|nr:TetR/AcrR family transcriptional regulator [Acidiferrobacterales bacterium]
MATPQPARQPVDAVERILVAAESLFAEHGFDAVSMSAIGEAAGVSKANVFHHFTSKNELYVAVLRNACKAAVQHLDDLSRNEAPLTERLPQFARAHLENLLEHGQVARLMLRELLSDNPRQGQELAEKVYGEKFSRFVAILRAGQQAGELRADIDPAMVATMLIGANVFFFESRDVLRHFPDVTFTQDTKRYSTMLADILLHGILPPHAVPTTNRNRT